jgi:hypothetical protein
MDPVLLRLLCAAYNAGRRDESAAEDPVSRPLADPSLPLPLSLAAVINAEPEARRLLAPPF